jgi:hypothetical protein
VSTPILTFALSDDGNSVFVYAGEELEACLGIQDQYFEQHVREYALHGVREALLSKQPH